MDEAYTRSAAEVGWAREKTRSEPHLLALVGLLKGHHRLGYFPDLFEVRLPIVEHLRGVLELRWTSRRATIRTPPCGRHREFVRARLRVVVHDPGKARELAASAPSRGGDEGHIRRI